MATVEGMPITRAARHRTFMLFAVLSACSSDPDQTADDPRNSSSAGRGSAACREWQHAYCRWNATCGGPDLACDQVKGIQCKSDDDAKRCATAMASVSCTAPPATCEINDLAERAPAQKACEDFRTSFCQRADECVRGAKERCMEVLTPVIDCTRVVGVTLSYEQCMASVPTIDCTTMALPQTCKGMLLVE